MNNFPFIDIFILAMIAIFIINRLRNVLGKKTGNEADIVEKFSQKPPKFTESNPDKEVLQNNDKARKSIDNIILHEDEATNKKLNEIIKLNQSFDLDDFIDGAKKAFEFILTNYASNNSKSLKPLLAKHIFDDFTTQIKDRIKNGNALSITILKIDEPKILNVDLSKNNNCKISLEFISQQVQTTKNKKGDVIDGNDNLILNIQEIWTFSKNIISKDPNWILEKIEENN